MDGSTYAATNNGDGTWTLADNTIAAALADGVWDVTVTATDGFSNVGSDATSNELTIDTLVATPGVSLAVDTGTSINDLVTGDGSLSLANIEGIESCAAVDAAIDRAITNKDKTIIAIAGFTVAAAFANALDGSSLNFSQAR